MDDLLSDFLTETAESLETVDNELVKFEADPRERATLDNIFRLVHTIKGTCGFLGLPRLEAVAHAGETLLGRFRDGALEVTPGAVTLVLAAVDRIKGLLAELAVHGAEPEGSDEDLISELEAASEGALAQAPEPVAPEPEPEPVAERVLRPGEVSEEELEAAFLAAEGPAWMSAPAPAAPEPQPAREPAKPVAAAEPAPAKAPAAPPAGAEGDAGQSIRVAVGVLEDLMTLVSELVLTRNQLMQIARTRTDSDFRTPLQRLSTITGELQDSVMKTRMQPIGAAWKKLPRLVRDVSHELGKSIDLVLEGEGTELDRQVLELIKDPLTHMVRNAADHGLETTEQRRAAGKPATGQIKLSAFHEGGCIVVRLSDDGKGLDTARIREKAIERGLVTRPDAEAMTDAQIHRFIFTPGFSTAATITNLSGRGVGMDVVRTNIEQIGGQIDLASTTGRGTTVTIKIPLTLAIISALIVSAAGQRFALPQVNVVELVRVGPGSEHRIEQIENVGVLRLRNRLLPLVELAPVLGLQRNEAPAVFVMILDVGDRRIGLVVDDVLDTEEIVVKPLAGALRSVPFFSGATILGDGSVVLIMDPNALAQQAGADVGKEAAVADAVAEDPSTTKRALLIVKAGDGAPRAVELSRVTRLEHVSPAAIEIADGRRTIQYRGRLTPVLAIEGGGFRTGTQPLLVFADAACSMALAVDEIVDVVEDRLVVELVADRPGLLGTAVIAGRATEVLDVDHYLVRALAEHARRPQALDVRSAA